MAPPGSRVWESRLHGSERGRRQLWYGRYIVAPPGNQAATEKTNLALQPQEPPVYSQMLGVG